MVDKYLQNRKILQKELAKIIKDSRLAKDKSISLISAEIGMTKSMWADMEKGIKDPQFSTIVRMSEGLDLPLTVLIERLISQLPENFSLIE